MVPTMASSRQAEQQARLAQVRAGARTGYALRTRHQGKERVVPSANVAHATIAEVVAGLPLLDNHCHGVLRQDPSAEQLEALIDEGGNGAAPGTTRWDSP